MGNVCNESIPFGTRPLFFKDAAEIATQMSQFSINELEELLSVNSKIALENYRRFQEFHSSDIPPLHAILSYTGIVFKRLNPLDFTREDFQYAQDHLFITSFCYGLLRPLDLIKPYRMEGDIKLPEFGDIRIFDYWRPRFTSLFIQKIRESGGVLVNLASEEMKQLFEWNKIQKEVRIVTPEFKTWKNGKLTSIVIYTKMARGEMTRYILKNQIQDVELLKKFEWEGFVYDPEMSDERNFIFVSGN